MKSPGGLTNNDVNKIQEAVKSAEQKVAGEIVPVLLTRSYHYPAAKYKFALFSAFLAFLVLIMADRLIIDFGVYDPLYYFTIVFGGAIIGFIIPVLYPALAVLLATPKEKQHATTQKAETTFLEKEVFNTRLRCGIMIFISFEEKQAMIMADVGINKKIKQSEWDSLVNSLIGEVRDKQVLSGVIKAIEQCSDILLKNGFEKGSDDTNELPDNLITD